MTKQHLTLTGSTVSFEWRIEDLGTHCPRTKLRQCVVHEKYLGDNVPDSQRLGPMPCAVAEAFIRARRAKAREMVQQAGGIPLLLN